jgi:type-F conjugative transfer system pilin assembly protein TrbC
MKNLWGVLFFAFFEAFAEVDYAKEGEIFALEKIKESKESDPEKTFSEAGELIKQIGKIPEGCKNCQSGIMNIPKESDSDNGILVFVSFSMPDIALKQLCKSAEKYNATVLIRGLHEGSFVKTKDKILEIDKNGLTLQIHPELFQKYEIKRIPAFILLKDGNEVNRLSGNVDLEFAYRKLEEQ